MKIRMPHINSITLLAGFVLFTIMIPWPFQLGGISLLSTDISSGLIGIYVIIRLLKKPLYRFGRREFAFLAIFFAWQFWMIIAMVIHPEGKSGIRLIWHIYSNVGFLLPFPFIGYYIGNASSETHLRLLKGLVLFALIAAGIGIVQTLSGGMLLSGYLTNQRFLGMFNQFPSERYGYMNFELMRELAATNPYMVNGFMIGSIFRAHGPFVESNLFTVSLAPLVALTLGLDMVWGSSVKMHWGAIGWVSIGWKILLVAVACTLGVAGFIALGAVLGFAVFVRLPNLLRHLLRPRYLFAIFFAVTIVFGVIVTRPGALVLNENHPVVQRLNRVINPVDESGFNGRLLVWSVALDKIADNLMFGVSKTLPQSALGYNNDNQVGPMSAYIGMAMFAGVPALLLLLCLLLLALHTSWSLYRRSTELKPKGIGFGVSLFLLVLLILGATNTWPYMKGIVHLFIIFSMMTMVLERQSRGYYDSKSHMSAQDRLLSTKPMLANTHL